MEIIQALGFGVIERLSIRGGLPCFDPEPRIVQEIKLGLEHVCRPGGGDADLTLKREFESIFDQLKRLGDGIVDVEIRHSAPFKLLLKRRHEELL